MKRRILLLIMIGVALSSASAHPPRPASLTSVVTEGVVNAPVSEVWKMWTTKEGIESWMVAKTDIDFRIGGLWKTSYSKEANLDGDSAIHQTILAYDPGRMVSYRTIKTPKNFPFPNAIFKTWVVVYLEAAGDKRTKVTAQMLGFTDDEESQKMRTFFESGNKTTLDNLIKKFQ